MKLSGGAALPVSAFGDLLDDLGGESIEVAGLRRGDHALVDDDWGIFPFGAGVDHVVSGENRHAFAGTKRMRCQARRRTISPPRAFSAGEGGGAGAFFPAHPGPRGGTSGGTRVS